MTVASTSAEPKSTASGIVERADTQQRVIPESRRADGSIRKERKVRPGFIPTEDVARYRPAGAREAEEARKRGIPGSSAAVAATSSSSTTSDPSGSLKSGNIGNCDTHGTLWRSSTARAAPPSAHSVPTSRPRGNFAPLEPAPARRTTNEAPLKNNTADELEAFHSDTRSWRNSRLRKQNPSEEKKEETAAVPDAWDQEEPGSDKGTEREQSSKRAQTSTDDLAAELDSLSINVL
ncbi:uncharacterized protein UDID_07669 [Ustilago sp. UG-2017a]|nr:uncharacterized protein UDID_07669 [Ustilago sp. UG-2017a]